LKEDKNTIQGAVFDHVGETAGLGSRNHPTVVSRPLCWRKSI
jgi:Na+-transporting NADH:ubiquinone oxidoreductase subunit NqrC